MLINYILVNPDMIKLFTSLGIIQTKQCIFLTFGGLKMLFQKILSFLLLVLSIYAFVHFPSILFIFCFTIKVIHPLMLHILEFPCSILILCGCFLKYGHLNFLNG